MDTINLPAKVRSKACYQQILGAVAMEPNALDAIVATVREVGLENIWKANEAKGEWPMFSPAVHELGALIGDTVEFAAAANPAQVPNQGNSGGTPDGPPPYALYNGTAIIPVSGPLSKMPMSLGHMFGGSSTVGMRKALALAMADKRVQRVMLHIDSPGGTVAGTGDLADDIFAARFVKPTAAYIEDIGASAAYWLASQTGLVYASPHAQIGSIGVITVVHDSSEAAKAAGIKVHVIKTAETKGGPIPGAPVTPTQLDQMQQTVDSMHRAFIEAVARGLSRMPKDVEAFADGRVHLGPQALRMGLVQGLGSFRTALVDFEKTGNPVGGAQPTTPPRQGAGRVMPTEPYQRAAWQPVAGAKLVVAKILANAGFEVSGNFTGTMPSAGELIVFESSGLSDKPDAATKHTVEAKSKTEDDNSSTPDGLLATRDTLMDQKDQSAGSPPAGAPTAEAFAALLRDVEALKAKTNKQEMLTLDGEKERILSAYAGYVSKEALAKVSDLGALQAVESVARIGKDAAKGGRTGADAAGKDYSAFPDSAARAAAESANLPDATAALQAHLEKQYGIMPSVGSPSPKPKGGA